ncbi:MAG: hypothetical protein ACMXX7_00830 [Candidatus Woesearchaeota archaeon]
MEVISEVEALNALKKIGPSIPLDVKRELNKGDSIVVGAALSELVKQKKVFVTNVKKGGSPYYFAEGQDIEHLHKFLSEKDKRVFFILREKKVLRDSRQEPLTRVSLRNMPDFCKKLFININGEKELFWRFYKIKDVEALEILKSSFKNKSSNSSIKRPEVNKNVQNESVETKPIEQASRPNQEKDESKDQIISFKNVSNQAPKPFVDSQKKLDVDDGLKEKEYHKLSEFEKSLHSYFDENKISILDSNEIRANSEYEFTLNINTSLGLAKFYCKARKKKKCNELDLSDALLQSNIKRLPGIFIVKGELTKKAKEKLDSDFKGLIIKEI